MSSDWFVYIPLCLLHVQNTKNPVQMAGFMVFCLIPSHIPSPTRKWKTRPYGMCFLASGDFVYLPSCIPHLHNPRNPVIDCVLGDYLILPSSSDVFCIWVSLFTFSHCPIPHLKMESMFNLDMFSVFKCVYLYSSMPTICSASFPLPSKNEKQFQISVIEIFCHLYYRK